MIFENFWNRRFTWLLSSLNISFGSSFEFSRRMCRNFELLSPRVVEYLLDPNIFRYSVFDLHPSIRILAELSLCEYQNATGSRNGIRVMTSISITRILDRGKFSISLIYIYIYIRYCMLYTHDWRKSRIWGTGLPRKSYLSIPTSWPRDKTSSLLSFFPSFILTFYITSSSRLQRT